MHAPPDLRTAAGKQASSAPTTVLSTVLFWFQEALRTYKAS